MQTLYLEKLGSVWGSWFYSESKSYIFMRNRNKHVIFIKAKKQGFNKFVEVE